MTLALYICTNKLIIGVFSFVAHPNFTICGNIIAHIFNSLVFVLAPLSFFSLLYALKRSGAWGTRLRLQHYHFHTYQR